MENDPDLMAFNNWRAVQPDVERSGLVFAANDHAAKSCSVWWAGPGTEFLDRMRTEAGELPHIGYLTVRPQSASCVPTVQFRRFLKCP